MKKILSITAFLLLFWGCSKNTLVEKNIEKYIHNEYPQYRILSAEYSDLYILHPLDYKDIPMSKDTTGLSDIDKFSAEFSHISDMSGSSVALSLLFKGCDKKVIDDIIAYNKIYEQWNKKGKDFVKIAFLKLEDEYMYIEEIPICFVIDSLYNVDNMCSVSDERYVYRKIFE